MPTLQIGRKEIAYELRRSATASERRITVTPGHVEVLALTSDNEDDVAGFLDRKREWLFNTVRDMERIVGNRHSVPRFITGSKIPFRGRNLSLTVRRTDAERVIITYRNGFTVDLPFWVDGNADRLVATELKLWLKQRARIDVAGILSDYKQRIGFIPRSIRVASLSGGWGAIGPEGNILINWELILAPKRVLEYVVIHELAHLRYRSHGRAFWALVGKIMPDYAEAKRWLEVNQSKISASFLEVN
ncbi:conserved protein of unknown function [uncultured Sphingopyxis sp.]|uniref:YgjP-like metallopeptidase domain-containing protein n=1 Tax=uncultured Sphingopyxis sp. TaxID=310581 RepID=A0A1Y5PT79_9SPHN|nr:SprT family zinc-dependent metalloprotease [uncultured Sphingopyxis sp.]SBV33199.1 conserved protein of unknown function [uncultured Sphingopyxis sp.]